MHALFDFSFTSFITTRIIKVVYAFQLALSALYTLFFVATAFGTHWAFGILMLLLAPLLFAFMAMVARMFAEITIVVFRGVELLERISRSLAEPGEQQAP